MNTNIKKRNIYIDIMKGFLITLVVIGHLQYFDYNSRTLILIYSFHMHSFLIIGGILSHTDENSKILTTIIKRIKNTIIPYFIFYLISFIIVPTYSNQQRIEAFKVVLSGIGIPPDKALNLPLWFLTFYFVIMTVFEIIYIIANKIKKLIINSINNKSYKIKKSYEIIISQFITLILISIIMFFSFRYARIFKLKRLPFNLEIASFCLGFVFFGNIIGKYFEIVYGKIKSFSKKNTLNKILIFTSTIILLVIILVCWYKLSMRNGRIDLNARDYKNAFYMYINAILGFILLATFSYCPYLIYSHSKSYLKLINSNNKQFFSKILIMFYSLLNMPILLLSYLGKNSIYILAYHVPSVFYTFAYVMPLLPISLRETLSHNSIKSIIIMTALGIIFSLLMSIFHKIFIRLTKFVSKKSNF